MRPVPPLHVAAHRSLTRFPSGGSAAQHRNQHKLAHLQRRAHSRLLLYPHFPGRPPVRPALPQDCWRPELAACPFQVCHSTENTIFV